MYKKEYKNNIEKEKNLKGKEYIEDFFREYTPKIFNILKKLGEIIAPITFIAGIIGTYTVYSKSNELSDLFGIDLRYFINHGLVNQYLCVFLIILIQAVTFIAIMMYLEKNRLNIVDKIAFTLVSMVLLLLDVFILIAYFFNYTKLSLILLIPYMIVYIILVIIILVDKVSKKYAIAGLTIVQVGLLLFFLVTIFFGQSKLPTTYEMIDNNQVIVSVYQGKFVVMNSEVDESKNSISIEKGNYYLVDIDEVHVKTRTFDLVKVEEK